MFVIKTGLETKKKKKKVTKGRNNHGGQSDPQKAKAKQKKVLKVFEFSFI